MQKAGILDSVFDFKPLVGTDTMSNNVMGNPTLQAVSPGVEPLGKDIAVGKMVVQVKTPIIARVTTPMLHDVQSHLDIKGICMIMLLLLLVVLIHLKVLVVFCPRVLHLNSLLLLMKLIQLN